MSVEESEGDPLGEAIARLERGELDLKGIAGPVPVVAIDWR